MKEFDSYINETQFTVSYDSGLLWAFEGGTNFWNDNRY